MKTIELMNWGNFKSKLQKHPELSLLFQYGENKMVHASYHITEIKQAPIVSVDCGGVMNSWTEVIIQLWEPDQNDNERAMQVGKALSIVDLVEKTLPLNPYGIVKIEFGNAEFDTRQMLPDHFVVKDDRLIVDLRPDAVQCKAIGRGGSCGTASHEEACCTPSLAIKKSDIESQLTESQTCAPGSGCC